MSQLRKRGFQEGSIPRPFQPNHTTDDLHMGVVVMVMAVTVVMAVTLIMAVTVVITVIVVMSVIVVMTVIVVMREPQHHRGVDMALLNRQQGRALTNLSAETRLNPVHRFS